MHTAALLSRPDTKLITSYLVITCLILVICDAIFFRLHHVKSSTDHLLLWTYHHDGITLGLHILMMILLTWMYVPPSLLVIAGGFIFQDLYQGVWGVSIAWFSSLTGAMIGGTLAFCRAKPSPSTSSDLLGVFSDRYPILRVVDTALVENPLKVMLLMRLSLIPFGVLNYVFAMKGVDMGLFIVGVFGLLPFYLFLVCLGASANSMYDGRGFIGATIGLMCGSLALVVAWRFAKDELQKEVESRQWRKVMNNPSDEMTAKTGDNVSVASRGGSGKSIGTNLKQLAAKLKLTKTPKAKRKKNNENDKQATLEAVDKNIVEDSDLGSADYVRVQILGEGESGKGTYREKLDLAEIILDDFS